MVTKAIRWYLNGLFPIPIYIPMLLFIAFSQYYLLTFLKSVSAFSSITQIFLIPIVVLTVASHFFRNKPITVFEITLIGSWRNLAIAKIITFTVGLVPLVVIESLILLLTKNFDLILPVLATIVVYGSLSLLASLSQSQMTAFMIDLVFVLLLPIGAESLLGSYAQFNYTTGVAGGIILYFLAPIASYEFWPQVVNVSPSIGLSVAFVIALVLIALYPSLFKRLEFKP